jgi:hypothetical protein
MELGPSCTTGPSSSELQAIRLTNALDTMTPPIHRNVRLNVSPIKCVIEFVSTTV